MATQRISSTSDSALQRTKPGARPPIRVGVLLDSLRPPAWIVQVLEDIRACDGLELVLLLPDVMPSLAASVSRESRLNVVSRRWADMDRKVYNTAQDAFAPTSLNPGEYSCEVLNFGANVDGSGRVAVSAEGVGRLKDVRLAVIVDCALHEFGNEIGEAATYGLWRFDPSNGRATNSLQFDLARFREGERLGVIATEIRVEGGSSRGTLVGKSFSRADSVSPLRGENFRYWRRSGLLRQRLQALRESGFQVVSESDTGVVDCVCHGSDTPGNLASAGILAQTVVQGIARAARRRFHREQWFIAVRKRPEDRDSLKDMSGFHLIRPPRDRFYADPFVVEEAGRNYIFFEDYRYDLGKGLISYSALDHDGNLGSVKVVLETPYHLSYPFIFRHQGQIFMMPETSAAGRIEVFRSLEFPERWERYAILIDNIVAFDPTMVCYDDKFWLFVSGVTKHDGENHDLSIYWAEDLFGKWHPHPENPIVSDLRRARPAGALFLKDGCLYRPAQDSSHSYGRAITVNRIDELTTTKYREVSVGRIEPGWLKGNLGTHTFNQNEEFQVTDGRIFARR